MQATWAVDVLPYVGSVKDDFGNTVDAWATTPVPTPVFGWAPAGSSESNVSRHTVTTDLELYAPPEFAVDPRDRIRILGVTYEIEGEVEDFTHGPSGPLGGGVRVNLRRF